METTCPKCGSGNTRRSRNRIGGPSSATLFRLPMRCRDCRHRFWVRNRSAYAAIGALVAGVGLFVGLAWLIAASIDVPDLAAPPAPAPAQPPGMAAMEGVRAIEAFDAAESGLRSVQREVVFDRQTLAEAADEQAITLDWYRAKADKGDLDAQYTLGLLHLTGKGALQDYSEAAKWLAQAAQAGHAPAQYRLGLIYRIGQGVPLDQMKAYMWLNLAAAAGVGAAVQARNDVIRFLSPEQLAAAQKASREWQATRAKAPPAAVAPTSVRANAQAPQAHE
jgi:hypothetical protein